MSSATAGTLALLGGLCAAAGAWAADDAAQLASGRLLFTAQAAPPCAVCHTLKDAGSSGAIGPNLDELQPDAARVASALKSGIGIMPSYRATLKDDQIAAIAKYVARVAGAK